MLYFPFYECKKNTGFCKIIQNKILHTILCMLVVLKMYFVKVNGENYRSVRCIMFFEGKRVRLILK